MKDLKIVLLVTGGRTGSDFFQSLLDGHTEIIQLPGIFIFNQFWKKIEHFKNINDIVNNFIEDFSHFFDYLLTLFNVLFPY